MACDMCGAKTKLFRTKIEGTEMTVCRECSKYGNVIAEVKEFRREKRKKVQTQSHEPDKELLQVLIENFHNIIKEGREKLNLTQKDFAQKIGEKESVVHKLETGSFEPNMNLVRKLEKFLKIRLVEQHEEVRTKSSETKNNTFTIGDFIKIKKRK